MHSVVINVTRIKIISSNLFHTIFAAIIIDSFMSVAVLPASHTLLSSTADKATLLTSSVKPMKLVSLIYPAEYYYCNTQLV